MAARIVYIEDEPEMIELVRLILGRKGYEVIGAMDGMDGLQKIAEYKPDLVLLDLMMPGMDGWDVYHQIRANDEVKETPVIIVTARALNIDRILGLEIAKVNDYLSKPFTPQALIESVQKTLNSREGLSSQNPE
ncbi:MAG: response regulator transcription factor [Anaerolineales bacterium]